MSEVSVERRFVRQLLLDEIGEDGQARLLVAGFRPGAATDPDAYAIAAEYLRRAGCPERDDGTPLDALSSEAVDQLAGTPALRPHAAAVLGAYVAVEHIKRAVGAGRPGAFPPTLTLRPKRRQSPFSKG